MRNGVLFFLLSCLILPVGLSHARSGSEPLRVGSKIFTESYILAEVMSQLLESEGYEVDRKMGLGGTLVAFQALRNQEIDIYPEYTGTISEVILKTGPLSEQELQNRLDDKGLKLLPPFGFNNVYALSTTKELAEKLSLKTISDTAGFKLKAAFAHEFFHRKDGWLSLKKAYRLDYDVKPIEHSLAYEAIRSGDVDLIVAYSTDGKIKKLNLQVLEDDKKFYPLYLASPLVHRDVPAEVQEILSRLGGLLNDSAMQRLNSLVEEREATIPEAARMFLQESGLIEAGVAAVPSEWSNWKRILARIGKLTLEHIFLVLVSTLCATLVAVPLGLLLFRYQKIAAPVLSAVGLLQTIPSLALLVYMIPWLGVTMEAALMALFLYSLLPILQNTYSGLQSVDSNLIQAARGIGLYNREILFTVQLPLALPIILAGVRVASVINVGMATIAAFIGSGGLGELIVQGLTLNNIGLMQQGAIPAAVLAIVMNLAFSRLEKRFSLD